MKVTALSDAHAMVKDLIIPSTDVLVYAGDWSNGGSMSETARFIYWMTQQPAKYKIAVAGNHDMFCEQSPNLARKMFEESGIIYLEDQEVTIEGKRFYGTPWFVKFHHWAFGRTEEWLAETFKLIPFNLDFLICHTPPKGILDQCGSIHIGSQSLFDRLEFITPKRVIFGHKHKKGKAVAKLGGKEIEFYNVSVTDEDYNIVEEPTVIEVK